ncbi:hypothetical protein NDI37_18420 [Funiculus sociatus GB2-A5]|uniref:Uncharacterized protein n=1 Tax=Funiculus sociatus GB2-A5 TaxID=2933946 RepID=A0ABV0JUV8_9CYAN|nr:MULTISPECIES: hypothetical protein [unclassified Trichocoleus]MBD2063640.1 hypothetical protein [Trichocoleus sp. FACHB-6]
MIVNTSWLNLHRKRSRFLLVFLFGAIASSAKIQICQNNLYGDRILIGCN